MELFKNTNFDFLGKKWPFIGLSLVLTAAGWISIATQGNALRDRLQGGRADVAALRPGAARAADPLGARKQAARARSSVQQVSGKPEVLIGTEIKDEKELNANRQLIDDTLRGMFSGSAERNDRLE